MKQDVEIMCVLFMLSILSQSVTLKGSFKKIKNVTGVIQDGYFYSE